MFSGARTVKDVVLKPFVLAVVEGMMNEPFERFREDRQMSSESTSSSRTGWLGQSDRNK